MKEKTEIKGEGKKYLAGEDTLVLLPRDPMTLFAYWEISPRTERKVKKRAQRSDPEQLKRTLRVKKHISSGEKNAFDIEINSKADNWYIHIDEDRKKWSAEIGFLNGEGEFFVMASSNLVRAPEGAMSSEEGSGIDKKAMNELKSGGQQVGSSYLTAMGK